MDEANLAGDRAGTRSANTASGDFDERSFHSHRRSCPAVFGLIDRPSSDLRTARPGCRARDSLESWCPLHCTGVVGKMRSGLARSASFDWMLIRSALAISLNIKPAPLADVSRKIYLHHFRAMASLWWFKW